MKISLNWLREYVDYDGTPDALAELLTMAGVEVEGIETRGANFEKVVVAQVLSREPHPNADRLSVCRVDDGSRRAAAAPDRLRGEEFQGRRQGAARAARRGAARRREDQGRQAARRRERGDAVQREGTPPRRGRRGLAHPLARRPGRRAHRRAVPHRHDPRPGNHPQPQRPAQPRRAGARGGGALRRGRRSATPWRSWKRPSAAIRWRGSARRRSRPTPARRARITRRGSSTASSVGPSPDWLRARLESVGVRSINNVVDVTNFVMLELGQPLHAFDAAHVGPGGIGVRLGRTGEELLALDGRTYKLQPHHLVIAARGRRHGPRVWRASWAARKAA